MTKSLTEKQQYVCKHIEKAFYELQTANKIIPCSAPAETLVRVFSAMSENNNKLEKMEKNKNEK